MNHCQLSEGFSIKEKLIARVSFLGMVISGSMGIGLSDPLFTVPYLLISLYGVLGIIQRHIVCPRCPHLHEHGDCLQLSPKLSRWLVKKPKGPTFSPWEKIVFLLIFFLIPVYPLYWLIDRHLFLSIFIFFTACWYGGQFFYFCKRCRVRGCPFNRAEMVMHKECRAPLEVKLEHYPEHSRNLMNMRPPT